MKCPKCQAELPDNAKFCGLCGQSLKTERVCPQCGQVNPQDFKFCLQCGHALVEPASQPAPPSPVPTSFADGRYQVRKFLGEGGKKKVYLVHDTALDRGAAFPWKSHCKRYRKQRENSYLASYHGSFTAHPEVDWANMPFHGLIMGWPVSPEETCE